MSLLSRIFGRRDETPAVPPDGPDETRAIPTNVPDQLGVFYAGGYSDAGVSVTEQMALTTSAVYSCVAVIAQAIAALPVHVLTREGGEKQYDHPAARLLSTAGQPNEYMTAPAWKENQLIQLLLWGNSFSYIERDELGQPVALLPLRSDRTKPVRINGQLMYETKVGGGTEHLPPQNVLHVANFALDGVTGISPIMQAKQSVGLSLALERFAARFFGQGCHTGGVLTVPSLKSDGMKQFATKFRENFTGPENSWKVAVLEDAMKWQPTEVNPEKSQALQQRVHQIREICRVYRVPAHKVNDLERATFSNIEHQSLEFVQDCLMPWVVKLEASFSRVLLLERERADLEIRFNLDGLLRADTAARYAAHAAGINAGFISVNEARTKEGLPKVEGGDVLRWPLNTAPVNGPPPPIAPAPGSPTPTPPPAAVAEGEEAGVTTDQTLNGAQIAAAIDVLDKLANKALVDFAAIELLVAVGIPRDKAETIVTKTIAAPLPPAPAGGAAGPASTDAVRALVQDAARRLLAKESKAVLRAAKKFTGKPVEFSQWAEEFYRRHEVLVARTLAPALPPINGGGADFAGRHCAESRAAVVAAFEAGTLDDYTDELETIRPAEVAGALLDGGSN